MSVASAAGLAGFVKNRKDPIVSSYFPFKTVPLGKTTSGVKLFRFCTNRALRWKLCLIAAKSSLYGPKMTEWYLQ